MDNLYDRPRQGVRDALLPVRTDALPVQYLVESPISVWTKPAGVTTWV